MQQERSWLCPTEVDRMRVVEASERVRRARIGIWLTIGLTIAATAPWTGWWPVLLLGPSGIALLVLDRHLEHSEQPERLAMGNLVFTLGLFAAAVALTGGPDSPVLPLVIIPAFIAPMRFRGKVVLALGSLTVLVLLAVTVGVDPATAADDPRLIIMTIALLICVTLANWSLVEAEMQQRDAAVLDPLTGLLNRKAHDMRILELEQQARLTGAPVALLTCDLDRFKRVNDTHGHDRGDAVLRSFAYQMRKALRTFELIYRLGGDEFLFVLPGAGREEALEIAERLRKTIEEGKPGGLEVTASFGISAAAGDDVVYTRMFKAADKALYEAKAAGRNRVAFADGPEPVDEPGVAEPVLAPIG